MHTRQRPPLAALLAGAASLIAAASILALEQADSRTPDETPALPQVRRQVLGTGAWESTQDTAGKRSWHAELKQRDDDSIVGRITVIGSAVVQEARIEAQVSGAEVYGVLVGDDEQQVGTFSGLVMKDGLGGTYTFENGDTGVWSWSGTIGD
jgi:hypothetical protein